MQGVDADGDGHADQVDEDGDGVMDELYVPAAPGIDPFVARAAKTPKSTSTDCYRKVNEDEPTKDSRLHNKFMPGYRGFIPTELTSALPHVPCLPALPQLPPHAARKLPDNVSGLIAESLLHSLLSSFPCHRRSQDGGRAMVQAPLLRCRAQGWRHTFREPRRECTPGPGSTAQVGRLLPRRRLCRGRRGHA